MGHIQEGIGIVILQTAGNHYGIRHIHITGRHQMNYRGILRHGFRRLTHCLHLRLGILPPAQQKEHTDTGYDQEKARQHHCCGSPAASLGISLLPPVMPFYAPLIQFLHIRSPFRRHSSASFENFVLLYIIRFDFSSP